MDTKKIKKQFFAGFVSLLLPVMGLAGSEQVRFEQFTELLGASSLVYEAADSYSAKEPQYNEFLQYEHAVVHDSGKLEIRYAIRPLSQIILDYNDPHSATPEPNHIYPLMFSAITDRLSGAKHSPSTEYSADKAAELFNADWAAVSVFDVRKDLSADYSQGTLLAIHGNKKADAYLVFLFNDYADVKNEINKALSTLKFEELKDVKVRSASVGQIVGE